MEQRVLACSLAGLLAASVVLPSISADQPPAASPPGALPPMDRSAEADKERVSRLAGENRAFAFGLFKRLQKPGENTLVSPHSISVAMAMAWAGSRGATQEEFARVLGWSAPPERTHADFTTLARALEPPRVDGSPLYEFSQANRLWPGEEVRADFSALLRTAYGADSAPLDFNRPNEAAERINAWTKEHTQARIEKLVDPGDVAGASIVLTNAIYFKGVWVTEFDKAATTPRPFQLDSGAAVDTPMMRAISTWPAYQSEELQAVRLPYRGGMSMTILLPAVGTADAFARRLDAPFFDGVAAKLTPQSVCVFMPKLKFSSRSSVKAALQALGGRLMFAGGDFSGIGSMGSFIGDVIHAADLEVDERGTVAAAATAIVFTRGGPPKGDLPMLLLLDRPFFLAITHDATGEVLFLARVNKPS